MQTDRSGNRFESPVYWLHCAQSYGPMVASWLAAIVELQIA